MSSMLEIAPGKEPMDVNQRLALRVRSLRSQKGQSLDRLAANSGVSRSMLSLIERGESSPTATVLDKVANALGVPLAALFDSPGVPSSPLSQGCDRTTWRDPS